MVWSSCSPRVSQESSPAPQFKSINSSALSLHYVPTLTSVHDYWKNHTWNFVSKMISLLLNTPFRFVIVFLPRSSTVESLSRVWLSTMPWTAAHQASLSITNSRSLLKHMSMEFSSCLQSFPASGSFPRSQFFPSGSQSVGVSPSTSVLPMNIPDWFHLGWTGWISLQCKGLSRVFSNTTVQKHQFFGAQLSL